MKTRILCTFLLFSSVARAQDVVSPESLGLDPKAIERLVEASEASGTDALLIVRDGKIACEWYSERGRRPLHLMSVTKLFAWYAIGRLIDEGKIPSLDTPISRWFPEWAEDERRAVTLRHILQHTSGLEHSSRADVLNSKPDRVAFARASRLSEKPGRRVSYNNRAIALLPGIVQAASGQKMDEYVDERLFRPLRCSGAWSRDESGQPVAYAELQLTARDLAKYGWLIAHDGRWEGQQLISRSWIEESSKAGAIPNLGLVWWRRIAEGERQPVGGGLYHSGWLGQYLVVYPEWDLVAVRLTQGRYDERTGEMDEVGTSFPEFFELLEAAVVDRSRRTPSDERPPFDGEPNGSREAPALEPEACLGTWRVEIDRGGFLPKMVRGRLTLRSEGGSLKGDLSLYDLSSWVATPLLDIRSDRGLRFRVRNATGDLFFECRCSLAAGQLKGLCRMGTTHAYEFGEQEANWQWTAERFADAPLMRLGGPEWEAGPGESALAEAVSDLVAGAAATDTDACIVTWKDRVLCDRRSEDPDELFDLNEITTLFSALALGLLIEEGRLESLDVPVAAWLVSWRDDPFRSEITLRHLLQRSTGLSLPRQETDDPIAAVLEAEPAAPPGQRSGFDARPIALVADIVLQVSGRPLDRYLDERLFRPLRIERWRWQKDGSGRPRAHDGLSLGASDLARVGQMLLGGGKWRGETLLRGDWLGEVLATDSGDRGPLGSIVTLGEVRAISLRDRSGQCWIVSPDAGLSVVRLTRGRAAQASGDRYRGTFGAIYDLLRRLLESE